MQGQIWPTGSKTEGRRNKTFSSLKKSDRSLFFCRFEEFNYWRDFPEQLCSTASTEHCSISIKYFFFRLDVVQ